MLVGRLANLPKHFRFIHTFCLQILNLSLTSSAMVKTPLWFVCQYVWSLCWKLTILLGCLQPHSFYSMTLPSRHIDVNYEKLLLLITILECTTIRNITYQPFPLTPTKGFNCFPYLNNRRFQILSDCLTKGFMITSNFALWVLRNKNKKTIALHCLVGFSHKIILSKSLNFRLAIYTHRGLRNCINLL